MKGTEHPAAAPKLQSPSTEEVQYLADEAEAILWNSSQQIKSTRRTVALNIFYIFEYRANIVANVLLKAHQSEPNQMDSRFMIGKIFAEIGSMPSEAPARGRVSNAVANLYVEGMLDLTQLTAVGQPYIDLLTFSYPSVVDWCAFNSIKAATAAWQQYTDRKTS